jgi:hypothetical protein
MSECCGERAVQTNAEDNVRRCSRCILPDDFPRVTFDGAGICNYCHRWDREWKDFDYEKAEAGLVRILQWAKSKKRQYDCLVPFSGGRDSSYVLYLCKSKYGLNPLAVTFNNLFTSRYALENIFNISRRLNVDHVFVTFRPALLREFYRAAVKAAGEFCSVCTIGINYVKIRYQRLFRIPLLISGGGSRIDENSPFEVLSSHPVYVRRLLSHSGFSRDDIHSFVLRRDYELSPLRKVALKLRNADGLKIRLPDYLRWNNAEIQEVLNTELGWQTPDPRKDHIDCKFAPVKYYLKNQQIPHFVFKQAKLSQLIRDGQISRPEALASLERLLETEADEPAELEEFIRFLELERQDVENREGKSHLDYVAKDDLRQKESLAYRLVAAPWRLYKRLRR